MVAEPPELPGVAMHQSNDVVGKLSVSCVTLQRVQIHPKKPSKLQGGNQAVLEGLLKRLEELGAGS